MSNPVDDLPAPHHSTAGIKTLETRRSTGTKDMGTPGPTDDQLQDMLTIASRTPDHGKLVPWRFIVFSGDARTKAGEIFAKHKCQSDPDCHPDIIENENGRFLRAPTVVAVVYSPKDSKKIPVWEQEMAAGAVCMNLLHAVNAHGFGAKWLSEWIAFDRDVLTDLGLAADEQIAGYIYIGTQTKPQLERARPDVANLITRF